MILVYQRLHGLLNVDTSFFFSPTIIHLLKVTISNYWHHQFLALGILSTGLSISYLLSSLPGTMVWYHFSENGTQKGNVLE